MNLHSLGLNRNNKLMSIELIPTDLPEPVVPAINKCGMGSRSVYTFSPAILFPKARTRPFWDCLKFSSLSNSPKYTLCLLSFGISIPIEFLPG